MSNGTENTPQYEYGYCLYVHSVCKTYFVHTLRGIKGLSHEEAEHTVPCLFMLENSILFLQYRVWDEHSRDLYN